MTKCLRKSLTMISILSHSEENDMKKIALALVTYMLLGTVAYACQTTTIIVNGKMTTCTVCGNIVTCF
jgi:uncharacterized membrane protein